MYNFINPTYFRFVHAIVASLNILLSLSILSIYRSSIFRHRKTDYRLPRSIPNRSRITFKDVNINGQHMIREVWASNLEQEMRIISSLAVDYPYVAMDTEFPGVVAKPADSYRSPEALEYQSMRCNVDILKVIQIGITLGKEDGSVSIPCCTWQFNFRFDLDRDPYLNRSISLLQQSGIDFDKFRDEGIEVYDFARLLFPSGLVMNEAITWVTFHSISDFGYLVKALMCRPLPEDEEQFFVLLRQYFPRFYDVKYFTSTQADLPKGLQGIADQLGVDRVGSEHQAGSDSFVTLQVFFELQRCGDFPTPEVENKLFGVSPPALH